MSLVKVVDLEQGNPPSRVLSKEREVRCPGAHHLDGITFAGLELHGVGLVKATRHSQTRQSRSTIASYTRRELRDARGDGLLSWVTSHTSASRSPRSWTTPVTAGVRSPTRSVSMAQNFYQARKVANPQAAKDIELFLSQLDESTSDDENDGRR